jgi:inhibitor of KinA sporulation pathway (predicted exonuclease)
VKHCYIVGDAETSCGTVLPPDNNMISLGACVAGSPDKTFYAELKLIFPDKWEDAAERIHGLSREHLRRNAEDPAKVMRSFWRWVRSVALDRLPVFCAKPVWFDFGHVEWYLRHFDVPDPFDAGTLDTKMLFRQVMGLERHIGVSWEDVVKVFPTGRGHSHNALEDALELEEVMRPMLVRSGRL